MSEARQRKNIDSLPQSDWKEIESVCDRFEQAWEAGEKPKLEDFLVGAWPTQKQEALTRDLLIVELDKRHGAGERTSAEEYRQRFSKFGSAVDQAFAAHDEWRTMGSSPGSNDATLAPAQAPTIFCPHCKNVVESPGGHSDSEIKCNTCGESFSLTADSEDTVTHTPPGPSQPPASTSLGDYEVFEEIARGGMGVVYKARHKKLNRTVALKMIHSGQLGSPEHRARFQLEAEAAAKLDHPGITPVYEIGEENGQPFFAMKLIEGGSLDDRLSEYVGDHEKAARLVADIAHAVHHAHQRGTLHRDLKPNNILIDNDGKPLVTDFGLAKFSDQDSGVTQTGAIMGTPGYMPPEQAASGKNVTTAADIYSLGAILFATLTGRPPFQGNTPMETVMQVVQKDAPKPSSINSKVPLELELISLKCLSRDPDQRYSSAAELAKDLENWLAGEPVSVRAPSMATLTKQFMKRNLRTTGGAALAGLAIGLLFVPIMFCTVARELFYMQQGSVYSEHFPSLSTSLLLPGANLVRTLPASLTPYFGLMLLTWCMFGLIVDWAAKPQDRNSAVTAGALAGVVGIVIVIVGWGLVAPMSGVQDDIKRDLSLLQELAAKDVHNLEKNRIRGTYPDLAEASREEKAIALSEKISTDVLSSIQSRLAFSVLGFLTMLIPMMIQAAVAYSARNNRSSALGMVVYYFEVVIPLIFVSLAVFVFIIGPLLGHRIPRPEWWRFVAIGVPSVLIWWAVARDANSQLRGALFVVFLAGATIFALGIEAGGEMTWVVNDDERDYSRSVTFPVYVGFSKGVPTKTKPGTVITVSEFVDGEMTYAEIIYRRDGFDLFIERNGEMVPATDTDYAWLDRFWKDKNR